MLRLLTISDFATIDRLEMELAPGLNVLTGETGAGKSIIIDALGLLLGQRADSAFVRAGSQKARVEGIVALDEALSRRVSGVLEGLDLSDSDDELVISREVSADGRSVCRVNGRLVPVKTLEVLGELLVDVHGQGAHLSLLRVREHLDILDRYAGLGDLRARVAERVQELRGVREELRAIAQDQRERAQRADLLQHQAREIADAQLVPGEDAALQQERVLAANAGRILSLSHDVYEALYDREGSASELLGRAARDLAELEALDPSAAAWREQAESLTYQAEELARSLRSYRDGVEHSPERLQEIEDRLEAINRLKRKYGDTIEDVLAFGQRASEELERLSGSEERAEALREREAALLEETGRATLELSEARKAAALDLAAAVEEQLADLAMAGTRFSVDFQRREDDDGLPVEGAPRPLAFDATGIDRVEFLVSPNPGEPLRPLARTASGGETSRLMLAIKTAALTADQVPTLVFDEVDAGIGGRVGHAVGQKLRGLADRHQALCVTHLPQIACFADRHLRVTKAEAGGRTVSRVALLSDKERVEEVSQMLGSTTSASRTSAGEMLAQAEQWKRDRMARLMP